MKWTRTLVTVTALCGLCAAALPAVADTQTAVSCGVSNPNAPATDSISRGFYVASYPATSLATVELTYYAPVPGDYIVTLRAANGTFDGTVIGMRTRTITFAQANLATPVVFDFQGVPVTQGETVAFSQSALGPAGNTLAYDVGTGALNTGNGGGSCLATETADFTAPLSQDRRDTVGLTITSAPAAACVASATTLCVGDQPGDNRFQVTVSYSTTQDGGLSGNGTMVPLADLGVTKGGLFWFFDPTNPEMLIKVINACDLDGNYWVFYSAGTNVGFTVNVTDTVSGHQRTYKNTDLTAAPPVQDTAALPCS
jgi:hypothetical protein